MTYKPITALRTPQQFAEHVDDLDLDLPFDESILKAPESPLAAPLPLDGATVGNRWCIQPMAGWDATPDGRPTELTERRWMRFGESGAKLVWGGESVAIAPAGRAHPNQLILTGDTQSGLAGLRERLLAAHKAKFGATDDLVVGLQLTHAGRWARPESLGAYQPRALYHHPLLDARVGARDDKAILADAELERIGEEFVAAAVRAAELGFDFVDLKHCHGDLLHECLGAHTRPGPYGGALENRVKLLRDIVAGIRRDAPDLAIGVRISAFDLVPFQAGPDGGANGGEIPGTPAPHDGLTPYRYGFGVNESDPTRPNLDEAHALLDVLAEVDIELVNVSAGSPFYTPHIERPAAFAGKGEYGPPEDPLLGVVRLLHAARDLKFHHPDAVVVASGVSYLQEFLPLVAQAIVREEWVDLIGLGRIMFPYPDLPTDVLQKGRIDRNRICRTFSACSTAPREGRPSGCYPLDPHFKAMPDTAHLSTPR